MEPRRSSRKTTSKLEAKINEEEDSNHEEGEIRGNKTPKATNHSPISRMGKADNSNILRLIDLDTDDLSTIRSTLDKHNLAPRVYAQFQAEYASRDKQFHFSTRH